MSTFFITGSARSGTTSLLRALELNSRVVVGLEPEPSLNVESRELYERRLASPFGALASAVVPRVAKALDQGSIYIEKHVSLVPFVSHLNDLIDCKFIVPIRDGREVVTSLINWHSQMFPIIYQECTEQPELSVRAQKVLNDQVGVDTFDYSLPRPPKSDPWHDAWPSFTRFEMVAWYWSYINNYLLDTLKQLPQDRFLIVDYTNPDVETIRKVYDFAGLSDFDPVGVSALLKKKVNSLDDRIGVQGSFPHWQNWSEELTQRFWDIAGSTMVRLGFVSNGIRPTPAGFGDWWREDSTVDPAWYASIYDYRGTSHAMFKAWCETVRSEVSSVVDIGSGIGHGYVDYFSDKEFVGIDLSSNAVHWSEEKKLNAKHKFICADILQEKVQVRGDLVFSQGTIDNVYDIDAFVREMARMSDRYVYIANYRGYFGEMSDHRYLWDKKFRVLFNDISAKKVCDILRAEGFASVAAFPIETGREDIPVETVIVACRDQIAQEKLMAGHKLHFDFAPYRVTRAFSSTEDVVGMVNAGCAYFSDSGLGLANPLSYFAQMLQDLGVLNSRKFGSMRELLRQGSDCNTAIRVDVDMDLVAGLEMAKISSRFHLPLTFYILHTAPYYGYMHEGTFYRHEESAEIYRAMQSFGCEVGLHVDALGLYLDHNIDGSQAVEQELLWLREQQIDIRGTSAHNCAPVYGAENFEVFKGRSVRRTPYFYRGGKYIPLETLDEQALGLEYEGSLGVRASQFIDPAHNPYLVKLPEGDFLRDPEWFKTYILANSYNEWGCGYKIWLLGKDMWVIAGASNAGDEVFEFGVEWSRVRDFVSSAPVSEQIIFTLHPIYLGARKAAGEFPISEGN